VAVASLERESECLRYVRASIASGLRKLAAVPSTPSCIVCREAAEDSRKLPRIAAWRRRGILRPQALGLRWRCGYGARHHTARSTASLHAGHFPLRRRWLRAAQNARGSWSIILAAVAHPAGEVGAARGKRAGDRAGTRPANRGPRPGRAGASHVPAKSGHDFPNSKGVCVLGFGGNCGPATKYGQKRSCSARECVNIMSGCCSRLPTVCGTPSESADLVSHAV
jgi:hypothetical protein